jgi:hypothetical protein
MKKCKVRPPGADRIGVKLPEEETELVKDCFRPGEIAAGALFAVRLRFLQQSHEHA